MVNVHVKVNSSKLQVKTDLLSKYKINIRFGDGVSKEKVKSFFTGSTKVKDDYKYEIPGRNIFKQYAEDRKDVIIEILRSSFALRFKKFNVQQQLEYCCEQIKRDIVEWWWADNIRPENDYDYKMRKGGLPTGILTGEMLNALEVTVEERKS